MITKRRHSSANCMNKVNDMTIMAALFQVSSHTQYCEPKRNKFLEMI